MKLLFDYFPIVCFFIAYKLFGVYTATAVAIGSCLLQNIVYWLVHRKFEKLHLITLASVGVLGSFTLIFHNAVFIQWKPTIIYWVFAVILLGSHRFSKKNLLARMLDEKVVLPERVWGHLNTAWAFFFIFLGFLNIYVLYHFSLDAWVNFKLFGTLFLTLLFAIGQAVYMTKYLTTSKGTNA